MNILESTVTETLEKTDFPQFGEIKEGWEYFKGKTVIIGYLKTNGGEWISIQSREEFKECFFVNNEAKISRPQEDLSVWNKVYEKVTQFLPRT